MQHMICYQCKKPFDLDTAEDQPFIVVCPHCGRRYTDPRALDHGHRHKS